MSFALSIAITAKVTDEELACIKAAGFIAVDLPLDAAAISARITAAGLKIACVTSPLTIKQESEILAAIAATAKLGSPLLRILPGQLGKGEGEFAGIAHLGPRLGKLAAAAKSANIALALQNAGRFASAKWLWQLIEGAEQDGVAACLDIPSSTLIGESPILTIPTLNSRIAHVRVWDYKESKPAMLGEGEAKIKLAIERLRGIGYSHFVSYAPPSAIDMSDETSLKKITHDLQLWAGLIAPATAKTASH